MVGGMVAQGVTNTRMRTTGRGELEPIEPNDTPTGQALNRRVEIVIVAGDALKRDAAN